MESLGLYLLKSAVWLTGFALVFLMVLRNERYFRLNRIYLLSGIVASIAFPFYTWHYAVVLPSVQVAFTTTSSVSAVATVPVSTPIPFYWWLYLVGMISIAIRLIWQTGTVVRKLRKTGYVKTGSVKLVRTAEYAASFSFFSFVFVNPSIADIETKEIVNHEREHIQQKHWFDLLLVELLCMLQWFNPFVWIYARLIRQNHEYLADEMALQHTSNPAIYQATLLNQMFGAPVISLANSFNYSLNKKRFKMMKKKIDSPFRKLRMLLVLPLVAMVFYAFAKPDYISPGQATTTDNVNVSVDGHVVKGKVVNPDGKPLSGTSVIIVGTNTGTITDNAGNFELKGVPQDGELVFSFVGFKTAQVRSDAVNTMLIKMDAASVGIDKVVVVGYVNPNGPPPPPPPPARIKIDSIDTKNPPLYVIDGVITDKRKADYFLEVGVESVNVLKDEQATDKYGEKGKYGVLEITLKKPQSVQPVPSVDIKSIDSKNPPIYFLDGVLIDKTKMDAINPDNIESINVLKDKKATDKYGENGKNGAIEIKTKKFHSVPPPPPPHDPKNPPLYILDGLIIDPANMNLKPEEIESISVLKDKSATEIYGEKAKYGAILIVSKEKAGAAIDRELAKKEQMKPVEQDQKNKKIFTVVEQMPEFPGGESALRDFIVREVKYPAEARKGNAQGKVFVSFVVNRNGKVENAKVVRGVHPALDAEAIRVVNLLSEWKPGKQHGKDVDVAYTIPIEFKLQ